MCISLRYSCLGLLIFISCLQSRTYAQEAGNIADSIIFSLNLAELENDSLRIDKMLDASLERHQDHFPIAKAIMLKTLERATEVESLWGIAQANSILGSYYAMEGNDSLSVDAIEKVIAYLQTKKDTANLLLNSFNLLNGKFENGEDELVIQEADSLIRIAELIHRPRYVALFRELKSSSLRYLDQNQLAIQALLQSIEYFEAEADSARLGSAYENLGLSYWELEQFAEARQAFDEAFSYYHAYQDLYYMAGIWIHLGEIFLIQDELDSAQFYFEKSLPINEQNEFSLLAKSYAGLSVVYGGKGDLDKGQAFFDQASEAFTQQGNSYSRSRLYRDWGRIWLEKNDIQNAYHVLTTGLKQIDESAYEAEAPIFFEPLAETYTRMEAWENAAMYWKKHADWIASRFETESVRQQQELMILYQTEKKEKELLIQEKQNADLRNESRIQKLNLQRVWIGSGLLVSLGLIGFILYRQKNIKRRIEEEQERKALELELEFKQRELTTHTLHLVSKNKLLAELKSGLQSLKEESGGQHPVNPLIGAIDRDLRDDADWENFERYFKQVYSDFDEKIKRAFPTLTGNEIRLVTLMKMNLSTKEIASILNVTPESVNKARYRLRKKINLPTDQNLQDYILAM